VLYKGLNTRGRAGRGGVFVMLLLRDLLIQKTKKKKKKKKKYHCVSKIKFAVVSLFLTTLNSIGISLHSSLSNLVCLSPLTPLNLSCGSV